MITKCLIIAAGRGSRLAHKSEIKPLTYVLGMPIIEHIILNVKEIGITRCYVVIGYAAEKIKPYIEKIGYDRNIDITCIVNKDWEKENGISVLSAKHILMNDNFILLMGDHIFDKSILKDMKYKNLDNVDIILAVDYNIHENRFVDIDDVTKVFVVDNMILDIGKDITQFNAYDTGIFLCSPNIFSAIEESINLNGDGTLSAAVRTLANKRRAGVFDIKDNFWIDIDNEQQLMKAEDMLMSLTKKTK